MIKKRESDLSTMAPHAEPGWVDEFVVEQRLLGVPGTRIGDALATVDAHLAQTGESAADAFGPPKEYARTLAESEGSGATQGLGVTAVVSAVLGLAGIVLLPRAFQAWLEGSDVTITTGDLVVVAMLAVLTTLILVFPRQMLRALVEHRVAALLAGPLLIAAFVVVMVFLRGSVAVAPALPVMVLAAIGLAVSALLSWREPVDLVQGPGGRTLGSATVTRVLIALLPTLFAVLMCLLSWITWMTM